MGFKYHITSRLSEVITVLERKKRSDSSGAWGIGKAFDTTALLYRCFPYGSYVELWGELDSK
jgi:hypothetical protein